MTITFILGIRGFINLWIGKENYLLNYHTVVLFGICSLLYCIGLPLLSLVNARGYFKDNKKHTFICAFVNIIISLVLVKFYKLDGLLIETSLAYLLNIIMKIGLVNKKIFKGINSRIYLYYGLIILSLVGICLFIKNIEVLDNYIKLPKIGKVFAKVHRKLEGTIINATVKKYSDNKYKVMILVRKKLKKINSLLKLII